MGPFQLPHTAAYYANGNSGLGSAYPNSRTMADDALTAMGAGTDFSPYDNDGNGLVRLLLVCRKVCSAIDVTLKVDGFIVVHSGPNGAKTSNKDDIWSVKWFLPKERLVDGDFPLQVSRPLLTTCNTRRCQGLRVLDGRAGCHSRGLCPRTWSFMCAISIFGIVFRFLTFCSVWLAGSLRYRRFLFWDRKLVPDGNWYLGPGWHKTCSSIGL